MSIMFKLLAPLIALRAWAADHKKLTATVVAAVVAMLPQTIVAADQRQYVVGIIMAYIVGQGMADVGKERAKIERRPPPTPPGA